MDAISGGRVRLGAVHTRVAGVLLAAGEGSRFGQPKALVELGGQTLAERGVDLLRAGGADPVLVVTGAAPVALERNTDGIQRSWRTGMGSSLRAALRALPPPGRRPRTRRWRRRGRRGGRAGRPAAGRARKRSRG